MFTLSKIGHETRERAWGLDIQLGSAQLSKPSEQRLASIQRKRILLETNTAESPSSDSDTALGLAHAGSLRRRVCRRQQALQISSMTRKIANCECVVPWLVAFSLSAPASRQLPDGPGMQQHALARRHLHLWSPSLCQNRLLDFSASIKQLPHSLRQCRTTVWHLLFVSTKN